MSAENTNQTSTAELGSPLGLEAHYGRLLGLLAARLHRIKHGGGTPTLQVVVDLDADTDPIDVYNALLQAAGAFGQNQQLRAYLGQLTAEHTLTLLTAPHMWQLLQSASAALGHHASTHATGDHLANAPYYSRGGRKVFEGAGVIVACSAIPS